MGNALKANNKVNAVLAPNAGTTGGIIQALAVQSMTVFKFNFSQRSNYGR
ncbi:MAG: hypothetical protein PWQ93_1802 [Clostridiales bacterium]|nr:hypothetical protein [Clostridiales bacterium]